MEVNREELLRSLETVAPGLAPRDIVEQSEKFVFMDGLVVTFNDEIYCHTGTNLKIEGAVSAAPLLSILRKLSDKTLKISVSQKGDSLILKGSGRRLEMGFFPEIFLPIDKVDLPTKWKKLPVEYSDAVNAVKRCASKDEALFMMQCVHIHPEWMESCDNFHLCRYSFKTGVREPCFVKRDSIKHMVDMGMTHFSETDAWVHYKNPSGMNMSCRRVVGEDYPNLAPILESRGEPIILPKGLAEAAERANVFSSEEDDNIVKVELEPGRLFVSGKGITGRYKEVKKIKFTGDPRVFFIDPSLLAQLVRDYNECEITPDYLRVDAGSFVYVTCLGVENKKKEADEE